MQCPFKKAGNEFTEIMVPVKITIPADVLGGYCFIIPDGLQNPFILQFHCNRNPDNGWQD